MQAYLCAHLGQRFGQARVGMRVSASNWVRLTICDETVSKALAIGAGAQESALIASASPGCTGSWCGMS